MGAGSRSNGAAATPFLVIEPGSSPLLRYVRDSWAQRDLLRVLTIRDLKLRYRQTVLGAAWVVLQPLIAAGVLSFVFNKVAKLPTDGVPTFIFAFAGMLGYNLFANTVNKATLAFLSNTPLVSKIFFPRILLPLSLIGTAIVDFGVAFGVMVVLLFADGLSLQPTVLLVPLWMMTFLALAEGVGSVLGSLSVRYRDVPQVVPVVIQLALFLSPVAYAASAVPPKDQWLFYLNPLAALTRRAKVVDPRHPPSFRQPPVVRRRRVGRDLPRGDARHRENGAAVCRRHLSWRSPFTVYQRRT